LHHLFCEGEIGEEGNVQADIVRVGVLDSGFRQGIGLEDAEYWKT
jgi:hypothetical protein